MTSFLALRILYYDLCHVSKGNIIVFLNYSYLTAIVTSYYVDSEFKYKIMTYKYSLINV